MVDFHVHSGPSLAPRHSHDPETLETARAAGIATFVLKAHEGSSAERAELLGPEAVGGVVLNSPVGGANPDAVAVAARFGARVVWLPTISSPTHVAACERPELAAHRDISFRTVPVVTDGTLAGRMAGGVRRGRPPRLGACFGSSQHGRGNGDAE